jgi:hypothetical protein
MFWNKKNDPDPLGVPISELLPALQPTSIKAELKDNKLIAYHEHFTVCLEVIPPEKRESENCPIQAVVRIVTEFPKPLLVLFNGKEAESIAVFNSFAALSALYKEQGTVSIGSRLTIYEEDSSWSKLHLPLLLFTTIVGSEAIMGGIRRTFGNEEKRDGTSYWIESDLEQVEAYLSSICFCTTEGPKLTAEFGLSEGAVSSALGGEHKTALFQLMADHPHPELGGGLFCLLQMPHQCPNEERLQQVCLELNNMEMAAHDLPPHFGAWCPGKRGNNLAYVSFLPNPMHSVSGIAVNVSIWAMIRAQWANTMLASMGVRA